MQSDSCRLNPAVCLCVCVCVYVCVCVCVCVRVCVCVCNELSHDSPFILHDKLDWTVLQVLYSNPLNERSVYLTVADK